MILGTILSPGPLAIKPMKNSILYTAIIIVLIACGGSSGGGTGGEIEFFTYDPNPTYLYVQIDAVLKQRE